MSTNPAPVSIEPNPVSRDKVPGSVSIEDVGNDVGKISVFRRIVIGFCYIASYLFSMMFFTMLMICSFVTTDKRNIKSKSSDENKPNEFLGPVFPPLTKDESVLKFDLEYYVQLQGYKLEEHDITTQDGFMLKLHRITVPGEDEAVSKRRYPVLMLHGLLQCSAAYLTSGDHSLAFFLVKTGHDVWLGNNRCGFIPKHKSFGPLDLRMWSWRIQEMGVFDLPCMVDYVRSNRQVEKIAYVAHSQGTTQSFFALASESMPDLGDKLSCFCALAPAVYTGPLIDRWFLRFIKHFSLSTYRLFFGYHSFLPIMTLVGRLLPCRFHSTMGYIMFHYLFGWDDRYWDTRYRGRQLLFSPIYISAELMYWWLGKDGFSTRGCVFHHELPDRPWFDSHFPPLQLVVPGRDNLVDPYKLVNRIRQVEEPFMQKVLVTEIPEYTHLDVLWASNVIEKVGFPMLDFIKSTRIEGNWLDDLNYNS